MKTTSASVTFNNTTAKVIIKQACDGEYVTPQFNGDDALVRILKWVIPNPAANLSAPLKYRLPKGATFTLTEDGDYDYEVQL